MSDDRMKGSEARKLLGVSHQTFRRMLRDRELAHTRVSERIVWIDRVEVERVLAERFVPAKG